MDTVTKGTSSPSALLTHIRKVEQQYNLAGLHFKSEIYRRIQLYSGDLIHNVQALHSAVMTRSPVMRSTEHVYESLLKSQKSAQQMIAHRLQGLDISQIWPALWEMAKEVALYVGGGAILGASIGGLGGTLLSGGVVAIPAAVAGAVLGAQAGNMLLALLDLKCLAETIGKAVPEMTRAYARGFALAWSAGELEIRETPRILYYKEQATDAFALGHLSLVIAVLSAIAVYLSKGNFGRALLLQQVSDSKLGPDVAEWIAANEGKIVKHPALQPMKSQAVKSGDGVGSVFGVERTTSSGGVTGGEKSSAIKTSADQIERQAKQNALNFEVLDDGHSIARHGPEVSDTELLRRLETGITPDEKFSPTPASTKFNSYQNWEQTRADALQEISKRNSVDLSKAPGPNDPLQYSEVVDHGRAIDDGFVGVKSSAVKVGDVGSKKVAKVYPDHTPVSGITRTTTTIAWNEAKERWDVVQHFPSAKNWNQTTGSYDD